MVADEWLRHADDQDRYLIEAVIFFRSEKQERKGRARSNSFDISAFPESLNSSVLLVEVIKCLNV